LKNSNWKDIAELIGIAAIVASLVFVGIQLRQEQQIALSQINQADVASSAQIDLAIIENREIWLKSKSGDSLSDAERFTMTRLVMALYRRARIEAVMRRSLGQSGHSPIIDLAVDLHENPGARAIWEAQAQIEATNFQLLAPGDDFRQSYQREIMSTLAELDRAARN